METIFSIGNIDQWQPLNSVIESILGSRDGIMVRALVPHQCDPWFDSGLGIIFGLSLLLVLFSAPRGLSLGTPVFPSPQKPTLLNSISI